MFIGHFAMGFAAKKVAPAVSLGSLFLAAQFVDLLWPVLLLLGIEHVSIVPGITAVTPLDFEHYPVSHSLLAGVLWGLLAGIVYVFARRYPRGALVIAVLVVSHWLLDLFTHRPDLPVIPGYGLKVGLGLWNSLAGTLALELLLFVAGLLLYLKSTRAVDRVGTWALRGLVVFLLLIHFANVFGEPPPSVDAIAWVGNAQWLLIAWGYWIDRHRSIRTSN